MGLVNLYPSWVEAKNIDFELDAYNFNFGVETDANLLKISNQIYLYFLLIYLVPPGLYRSYF